MDSSSQPDYPPAQNPDAKAGTIAVALLLVVILLIGLSGMLIAEAEPTEPCPPSASRCMPRTMATPPGMPRSLPGLDRNAR